MNKTIITITLLSLALVCITGCDQKEKNTPVNKDGMKCGAGKCGASMANGSTLLVKKKVNILNQMRKGDNRRNCVLNAKTTKALYACVRVAKTGRLSIKCNTKNTKTKTIPKKTPSLSKCESGKCNSSMKQKK